ncbi:uncharacterized protein [Fopius arisanus]|uniref:Uncharacterized protein n=1 Tax=Fopius arisanus TaxID=64838 RepID=A0A9R1TZ75_9HYME|nr:PREDICTED: uncharacterized protein LOC105265948 [Fopius arisanus]
MGKLSKGIIILLVLGVMIHQYQVHCLLTLAIDLLSFAWSTLEKINAVHDVYGKVSTPSTAELMQKSVEIADSIDKLGVKLEEKIQQSMDTLLSRLPLLSDISANVGTLNEYVTRIDALYRDMNHYLRKPEDFSDYSLQTLLKSATSSDGDDVDAILALISGLINPKGLGSFKESLFVLLAKETQEYALDVCGTGAPPQQRLVELFDIIIETEMRGFALLGFGYMMKSYMENTSYIGDVRRAEGKLETRAAEYVLLLKSSMSKATTQFRNCDPLEGNERGVTFIEFEKFLQAFITQEGVFRVDHRCPATCGNYGSYTRSFYGCRGFECTESPTSCFGWLVNCRSMKYLASACEYDGTEVRRYKWFKDGDGKVQGVMTDGCPSPGKRVYGFKVTYEETDCDLCRCICVQDTARSNATHFLSLQEQVTNVEDNMVITGLQFVVINRVVHLKIMQSQITNDTEIVANSTSWVEPEEFIFDQAKSMKYEVFHMYKNLENGEREELKRYEDYYVLNYENRRFCLDRMMAPTGYIVTGVKFDYNPQFESKSLKLKIRGTRFDAETNQLDPESSIWLDPEDMPYAKGVETREEHDYEGWDNPTKSSNTLVDSRPYTYIDVDWSSYAFDAAQTTIPLLDAMPIFSDPIVPLRGVGLYHKRQVRHAGFLTLVLEAIDRSPYIKLNYVKKSNATE